MHSGQASQMSLPSTLWQRSSCIYSPELGLREWCWLLTAKVTFGETSWPVLSILAFELTNFCPMKSWNFQIVKSETMNALWKKQTENLLNLGSNPLTFHRPGHSPVWHSSVDQRLSLQASYNSIHISLCHMEAIQVKGDSSKEKQNQEGCNRTTTSTYSQTW